MTRVKFTLILVVALIGCETVPKDAFLLPPSSLEDRQIQSRIFETADEVSLIVAGISVLQDMGYSIDETEKDAGLITASKSVDATNSGQIAAAVLVALLGGGSMPVDKEQKVRVSFVTLPSKSRDGYFARITFQRIIWNSEGKISRVETLNDVDLYANFFDKLSKSVFLEAHNI